MNDIVKTGGGLPMNQDDLLGALKNVNSTIKAGGGLDYLRMMGDGYFVYGADNTEVEEGSQWAINPYTIQHGFVCWTDYDKKLKKPNELVDEVMAPMNQPKPLKSELPDVGEWDWSDQVSVQLQCLSGEDKGVTVLYKGSSKGLASLVSDILVKIINQIESEDPIVPVGTLDSSHYDHKTYGRTYTPKFDVTKWVNMDGLEADEDEAEDKPKAAKKKTAKKAKKEVIEPVDGEEPEKTIDEEKPEPAPQTRRRRRSTSK